MWITVNPAVKTSLGPGSRVVTDYLTKTGLQAYLDQLGFQTVGYGCTTCIGNSGPLLPALEEAIAKHDLITASVLSGNRNFEARVHQNIKANFLMSPPLVVAFALAGRVDIDLTTEPITLAADGSPVFLRELWPSLAEISSAMASALSPEVFRRLYADFATQNPKWNEIPGTVGDVYAWDAASTYIQEPPFFTDFSMEPGHIHEINPLPSGLAQRLFQEPSAKSKFLAVRFCRPQRLHRNESAPSTLPHPLLCPRQLCRRISTF